MNCTKCGSKLSEGSTFCMNCGQKIEAFDQNAARANSPVEKPKKRKTSFFVWFFAGLSLLLAAALVIVLILPSNSSFSAGSNNKGFDTPEEAIEHFIGCINNGDIEGAIKASYIQKAVENYDFEYLADRLGTVSPVIAYPSEYEFYYSYNINKLENQMLRQINAMVLSLTQPEYASVVFTSREYVLKDEKADYEGLDPILSEEIQIIEIAVPRPDLYYSELNQENMKKQRRTYNADGSEWRAVLYKYDGDYYAGGFQLFEYDGKYYVVNAKENLIGQPPTGELIPLGSKSDFDDLVE